MRRIFSILVLLIITWQIVGFFTYFELEHYHIRKDIKRALKQTVPENQLKNFDFTKKEVKNLTWIKSNEFKLNGRFYDVVERTSTKNGFHFKCIDDFQETQLFQNLEESTAYNLSNSSSSSPLKHWLKLLKTPYDSDFFTIRIGNSFNLVEDSLMVFFYKFKDSTPYTPSVFTPPKNSIS